MAEDICYYNTVFRSVEQLKTTRNIQRENNYKKVEGRHVSRDLIYHVLNQDSFFEVEGFIFHPEVNITFSKFFSTVPFV